MSFIKAGRSACFGVNRLATPVNARFASSVAARGTNVRKTTSEDTPTTRQRDGSLINKETPEEAMARHQPDYNATIDHGTSYESKAFSAVVFLLTASVYQVFFSRA